MNTAAVYVSLGLLGAIGLAVAFAVFVYPYAGRRRRP